MFGIISFSILKKFTALISFYFKDKKKDTVFMMKTFSR